MKRAAPTYVIRPSFLRMHNRIPFEYRGKTYLVGKRWNHKHKTWNWACAPVNPLDPLDPPASPKECFAALKAFKRRFKL